MTVLYSASPLHSNVKSSSVRGHHVSGLFDPDLAQKEVHLFEDVCLLELWTPQLSIISLGIAGQIVT